MTGVEQGTTIGLLAASILLCVAIAAEISDDYRGSASYPVTARVVVRAPEGPLDAAGTSDQQAGWLNEIMARPLFSPTRRPVGTTVSGLPRLTGIVLAGSQRVAIFAVPANEHPIVAQAGTRVGAYEVRTIAEAGVTIVGPGGTTLIRPIFDVARPAGSALPPAPSARAQPARPATQ